MFPTAVADPTQACLVQRKSHRYSAAVTSLVLTAAGSEALVCTDNCQVVPSSATLVIILLSQHKDDICCYTRLITRWR